MGQGGSRRTIGWALDRAQRETLLRRFTAAYPDVVADHVTLASGVSDDEPLPAETHGEIMGVADDGAGVQALMVKIGGTISRPDGGVYHITWSLDRARGREARDSNQVIADRGWKPLATPVPVKLIPWDYRR